jgi:predicted heme/steroid binding protein
MVYTFTEEELSKYDGVKNEKIYLSVRGTVYNVTKASDFYGPGKTEAVLAYGAFHTACKFQLTLVHKMAHQRGGCQILFCPQNRRRVPRFRRERVLKSPGADVPKARGLQQPAG